MKLVKFEPTQLTHSKDVPGLLRADFTHTIKESEGRLTYVGPKIPVNMWREVVSFFKWTYDTTKSESQVRLYVNPAASAWAAWAFPQEARTGMSARELVTDEGAVQREQFADSEGWLYFGTVHHHCSASAFQSGTDEANEKDQHGIHITVGSMDKAHHDLHVRFYLKDARFDVDMSMFWDIGEIATITPPETHNRIAMWQMGLPSTVDFPQQWKDNLIEAPKPVGFTNGGNIGTQSHIGWQRSERTWWERKAAVAEQLKKSTRPIEEIIEVLQFLDTNPTAMVVLTAMRVNEITWPDVILKELLDDDIVHPDETEAYSTQ